MIEKIRPLYDRVLIKRTAHEEKTAGGIIIPDVAKEKGQIGEVIAIGSGHVDQSGKIVPLHVKVGDKVFFGKYSGTEIDENYIIIKESEILGVVGK